MSRDVTPFDAMDRMFDQMRHSMGRSVGRLGEGMAGYRDSIRLEETDGGYVAVADLPGFEPEDIEVRFGDGVLTITGTHAAQEDTEYRYRSVNERVRVPAAVRVEDASASYHNGVLEVTLPTDEGDDAGHRIDIE